MNIPEIFLHLLLFPVFLMVLSPFVSPALQKRLLWLKDKARSMGIHIQAGKGSGKSRLMGRIIAWLDFLRGVPTIIFDPHGPTIDNFLDKNIHQPEEIQEKLWPRVLYVDMSGKSGQVIPFPLYYKLGNESLYEVSQRYLDVIRKLDPFLQTASVEGWNPLWRTGTYTGMFLAALGLQITEAEHLLRYPMTWQSQMHRARSIYPELEPAAAFLRELNDAKEGFRERKIGSFTNKTAIFGLDPAMQAMFGERNPGVDWQKVLDQRLIVLLDFRHVHDIERKRFKMMWAFNYFLNFVKHRGAGRHMPVSLIIDELVALFSIQAMASDLFATDLDDLINVIARNYSIWLTIAHQELFQFSEHLQKTLMTMGTQMLGVTSDPDAAETLAHRFFQYDPYWVKKYERVWMSDMGSAYVIDHTSVEFTPEEQTLLYSQNFTRQGPFQFLVRPAPDEGDTTGALRQISIASVDRDIYPDEALVAQARDLLMQRNGRPVLDVIREIEARKQGKDYSMEPGTVIYDEEPEVDYPVSIWSDE